MEKVQTRDEGISGLATGSYYSTLVFTIQKKKKKKPSSAKGKSEKSAQKVQSVWIKPGNPVVCQSQKRIGPVAYTLRGIRAERHSRLAEL